jgi:hypothetical protein
MNGLQIKGSARGSEAATPASGISTQSSIGNSTLATINLLPSAEAAAAAGIETMEELIKLDSLTFLTSVDGSISASAWALQLKLKLKQLGANHFCLYKWPPELMFLLLEHPLSTVLGFEREVVRRNEKASVPPDHHESIRSWESVDNDKILCESQPSIIIQADPLLVLSDMFSSVFKEYPEFKLFFTRQMSPKEIQEKLYQLYVGMWVAKVTPRLLINHFMPTAFLPFFGKVDSLSDFFQCLKDIDVKWKWLELENLFKRITQMLKLGQPSMERGEINDTLVLAMAIKGILKETEHFRDLSPEFIRHFNYVQLLGNTARKLGQLYEGYKEDKFDLEALRSMHPPKLLTNESASALLKDIKASARQLRHKSTGWLASSEDRSSIPPMQQRLPSLTPSDGSPPRSSFGRSLSEVITGTPAPAGPRSPAGSISPANSTISSISHRFTSPPEIRPPSLKKLAPKRRSLKWLDPELVASLKKKIAWGTLTREEEELVQTYSFVFHYSLAAKQKRYRGEGYGR